MYTHTHTLTHIYTIYTHACMHAHMCTYKHTYTQMTTHTHTHTHHTHTYTHTPHTHIQTTHINMHINTHKHGCMHTHTHNIHTCMHTQTHMHTHACCMSVRPVCLWVIFKVKTWEPDQVVMWLCLVGLGWCLWWEMEKWTTNRPSTSTGLCFNTCGVLFNNDMAVVPVVCYLAIIWL